MAEPTRRLYWEDDALLEAEATLTAVGAGGGEAAFDRTCFYPGGGGQPPDRGEVTFADGTTRTVAAARTDEGGVIWHVLSGPGSAQAGIAWTLPEPGTKARLRVDAARRNVLARYHTALHVLNTVALRDYAGWITGVQIGEDYSRIDFRLGQLTAELCRDLETKVNAVLEGERRLEARFLPETEFRERPDLLRTLEAKPPVVDGRVRVVGIEGFDEQACGGTHVGTTAEVGRLSIYKVENKGKNNKRLYVRLDSPAA